MAKMAGTGTKTRGYDAQHGRNINATAKRIEAIYDAAAKRAAAIGVSLPAFNPDKPFEFAHYPAVAGRGEALVEGLRQAVEEEIISSARKEWGLANEKDNALAAGFLSGLDLSEELQRSYYSTNDKALEAFLSRKSGGMSLSDKVWKYSEQFKTEIEDGIDIGLRDGLSAGQMATRLKSYLRDPDKLFRRVRNAHGALRLSRRAAAYHPGRGVYRSSYRNARRLAATETNLAYRTADHLRWQQMDFVVGIKVQLSNNHNCKGVPAGRFYDICDELQGRYPKDFKFTGWHPLCRCYATPVLMSNEEFAESLLSERSGGKAPRSANEVTALPDNFKEWVERNIHRIDRAKNAPYFIRDNYKGRIKEYAHYKSNEDYTNVAFNYNNGGLRATHKNHSFDPKKGWYETAVQEVGYNAGNSVILGEEAHNILNRKSTDGLWNGKKFEIATAETATPNNIRNALKHCASKPNCEVAGIFFPNNYSLSLFEDGLGKYIGLKETHQYKKFGKIICISKQGIQKEISPTE